jgi:eukaryotic-like serine/threonine-protein kinase
MVNAENDLEISALAVTQPSQSDSLLPPDPSPIVLGGRYEILGLLGMGGMGAVYRARDSALSEIVALKMLRPGFAADGQSLLQLRQEVRLARRVTHKNVARTYDLGEADGHRFLTMELVDGPTLAALIDAGPLLPIARTIEIALAICDGVAAAHDAGVVHRDLKPDNVAIARDGRVVVMDFGVARSVGESTDRIGLMVGTPPYMAPEQAQNASDLDGRADQYALGSMIFEMLTGEVPFPGAALSSIVRRMIEPPPDPRDLRPEVPEALAKVVLRCLARAREDRFEDLHAVGAELRRLRTVKASVRPPPPAQRKPARGLPRLAIFPLAVVDLPEGEHLGWGFADGLIDALSAAPGLSIYPRGVTSQVRDGGSDPRACGRLLGAEVVVHGSLRRASDGIVAHVRLTTVEDGFQIWHQYLRGRKGDVERCTDEAARGISEAMGLSLPKVDRVLRDPEVLDLFLRGRREHFRFTTESNERAQELLRLASERAPNDPVVLSAYASALGRQIGVDSRRAGSLALARSVAERAHAAAPERPEPIVALASVALQSGDAAGAADHAVRALALAPGSAEAHELAANLFFEAGALRDGHAHMEIAIHLEPRLVGVRYQAARSEALTGNWIDVERLVLGPLDAVSPFSYWADRFRLSLWRGDAKWIEGLDVENLPGLTAEEKIMAIGAASLLRERKLPAEVGAMIDGMRRSAATTPRAKTLLSQLQAEARGYCEHRDTCAESVLRATETGLFDSPWLELCPALESVRERPEIVEARAVVKERARAVLAALLSVQA